MRRAVKQVLSAPAAAARRRRPFATAAAARAHAATRRRRIFAAPEALGAPAAAARRFFAADSTDPRLAEAEAFVVRVGQRREGKTYSADVARGVVAALADPSSGIGASGVLPMLKTLAGEGPCLETKMRAFDTRVLPSIELWIFRGGGSRRRRGATRGSSEGPRAPVAHHERTR